MTRLEGEQKTRADEIVDNLAAKGYRTLGVARSDEEDRWKFLGILPLYDPPREDSAETIANAKNHGIDIKMVTGDNQAIAREISKTLGLGTNIQPADELFGDAADIEHLPPQAIDRIEKSDGFAQVFPNTSTGSSRPSRNGAIWSG